MLCGQDSFIVQVKLENVYGNLPEDVQIRFGTSKFEVNRPLPIGKNKKIIGLMKDESGRRTMKGFFVPMAHAIKLNLKIERKVWKGL